MIVLVYKSPLLRRDYCRDRRHIDTGGQPNGAAGKAPDVALTLKKGIEVTVTGAAAQ